MSLGKTDGHYTRRYLMCIMGRKKKRTLGIFPRDHNGELWHLTECQTEHGYRHRAPGIKERMGSTEERPYKTVSRTQSFSWHFPIEYTQLFTKKTVHLGNRFTRIFQELLTAGCKLITTLRDQNVTVVNQLDQL